MKGKKKELNYNFLGSLTALTHTKRQPRLRFPLTQGVLSVPVQYKASFFFFLPGLSYSSGPQSCETHIYT